MRVRYAKLLGGGAPVVALAGTDNTLEVVRRIMAKLGCAPASLMPARAMAIRMHAAD